MMKKILGIVICVVLIIPALSGLGIGNINLSIEKDNSGKNYGSSFESNMTVSLSSFNPPITIPTSGGYYQYSIEINSNIPNPTTFDVWTMYTLPNGSMYGPVFGPAVIQLPDKWSAYKDDLSTYVAGNMPPGTYTYTAYIGTYNSTILDSDNFTFEKLSSTVGWYPQVPGVNETLRGVSFSDTNNGWAVGDYFTIIHTTNGGDTWYPQDDGQYYIQDYNDVYFIDNQTGWVVGSKVLHTTNGGTNWTEQYDPGSYTLRGVFFTDANNGWIVGGYLDYYGYNNKLIIIHTPDGGDTWTTQLYQSYSRPLNDVFFIDASTGWATGESGEIFHTTDGGDNWIEQNSSATHYLNGIAFTDANNGWCVGEEGTVLSTTNGGTTWSPYSLGTGDNLNSIFFTDTNNGWIAGGGYYPYHGSIFHTSNGGTTWELQDTGTGDQEYILNDIWLVNETHGWATGGTFYPWTGVMLSTENGGGSSIQPVLSYTPSVIDFGDMYGAQNDTTNITIWNNGTGTLAYYVSPDDTWITVLPEGGFSSGEHDTITVTIDTGGLQPGTYQCNITITSNGGNTIIPVSVHILVSNQILGYSPHSYDFGDVPQYQLVTTNLSIWNNGTGTMYYWIDDSGTFCVVDPWSGSSQGEVNNHTVMCFTSSLDPGPHQCNLTIYGGGNGIFTVYVNVTSGGLNYPPDPPTDPLPSNGSEVRGDSNNPPNQPSDPLPFNGSINSQTSPVLSVMVTDPNAEMLTVSFYNASDDSLIGTDYQVMNGTRAYAMWNNLAMNRTYSWYAVCHDQENTTQSDTWEFTLMEQSSPPPNVNVALRMGWNMIGWFPGTNTTAESLGQTINGCTVICMFDGYTQSYTTHVVGIPYNDFTIYSGMGLFVYTTINSIWHGEG